MRLTPNVVLMMFGLLMVVGSLFIPGLEVVVRVVGSVIGGIFTIVGHIGTDYD